MRGPPDVVGDSREQAHLPAEQPPARQDPRLPAAHAHPCRPRDPRGASPQGPRGALGLTPPSVLLRCAPDAPRCRLRAGGAPGRARRTGHPRGASDDPDRSLALPGRWWVLSSPRPSAAAVTRNLVKRRLRELVRARSQRFPPDAGIVVRALPPAATGCSTLLGRRPRRRAGDGSPSRSTPRPRPSHPMTLRSVSAASACSGVGSCCSLLRGTSCSSPR